MPSPKKSDVCTCASSSGYCEMHPDRAALPTRLRPCPFCHGDKLELLDPTGEGDTLFVQCMCGATGPHAEGDEQKAIENWNRRIPMPLPHSSTLPIDKIDTSPTESIRAWLMAITRENSVPWLGAPADAPDPVTQFVMGRGRYEQVHEEICGRYCIQEQRGMHLISVDGIPVRRNDTMPRNVWKVYRRGRDGVEYLAETH